MKKLPLLLCLVALAWQASAGDLSTIDVTASADTLVVPNEIYVKIRLNEKDQKGKVSIETMESQLFKGLMELGTNPDKNLSVSDMASNYQSYFWRGQEVNTSKEYTIKLNASAQVSNVFQLLAKLGLSDANIDRVEHSNIETLRNLMRVKAIQQAQQKAKLFTQAIQQHLGNATHIAERDNDMPYLRSNMIVMAKSVESSSAPNINFEKISVKVTVDASFLLLP